MITGVAGFVLSIISYRRAGKLKKLDLFIDAGRVANALRNEFALLKDQHERALSAKKSMCAATGQSGRLQVYEKEWAIDKTTIGRIEEKLPPENLEHLNSNAETVSGLLVKYDEMIVTIKSLRDKYTGWEFDNAKESERLRNAAEARVNR